MKLIKCYVNNFGCLSNYEVNFNEELNSFLQENGEGKTTFASFIKAMLYGMDSFRENSTFNDRKHYIPFQGGHYGGSLTIEYKGNEYTIERKFDEKSKTKDHLKITDHLGNEPVSIEGKIVDNNFLVGDVFVGIDEEAFKKCNFIYSNDLNFKINDSIKMKINDLVVDLSKENSYSDVMKNVGADLKENRKDTKSYGTTFPDKVKQRKQSNESLNRKIRAIRDFEIDLAAAYEGFNSLKQRIDEIKVAKQELNKKNIVKENWDTLASMESKLESYQSTLKALDKKYSSNMPSEGDLKILDGLKNRATSIQRDVEKYKENPENKLFIESYAKRYKDDKIDKTFYEDLNSEYVSINSQEDTKNTYERPNTEKLNVLKDKFDVEHILPLERINKDFGDYKYNKGQLEKISSAKGVFLRKTYPNSSDIEEANEKIKQFNSKRSELFSLDNAHKEPPAFLRVLLIIFTLGIYLLVSKKKKKNYEEKRQVLFEEIEQLAKALDTIFAKFEVEGTDYELKLQKLIVLESAKTTDIKISEINALNNEVLNQEKSLKEYFFKFGYESEKLETSYNIYINDYKEYKNLLEKQKQYDNQISQIDAKVAARKENLNQKLNKYFAAELSIIDKLSKLKFDIAKKAEYDERNKFLLDVKSEKTANDAKIKEILDKYSILSDRDLNEIYFELSEDLKSFVIAEKSSKERKEEIEKFKIDKNLTVKEDEDITLAFENLYEEEEQKKAAMNSYDNRIKELESEIGREDDYKENIQENLDLIAAYEHEIDIIEKTKKFITAAEVKLEEKYLTPVKEKFDAYSALIKKEIGINTKMNFDYDITREVNGQIVGSEYLSDGEKTVIMLALRFAVIDNLYKDNDTFVILDDPLVFLDPNNLEQVKSVIKELSKEKQIIYFACHDSRKI